MHLGNKAAVLTLRNPRQQSGQEHICSIYESIAKLRKKCDKITVVWLPSGDDDELWTRAKEKAKEAIRQGEEPQTPIPRVRLTTLNMARITRGTSIPRIIDHSFQWDSMWWSKTEFIAFNHILERPWFRRRWVIQEAAYSAKLNHLLWRQLSQNG
jgi:hypothetical protein